MSKVTPSLEKEHSAFSSFSRVKDIDPKTLRIKVAGQEKRYFQSIATSRKNKLLFTSGLAIIFMVAIVIDELAFPKKVAENELDKKKYIGLVLSPACFALLTIIFIKIGVASFEKSTRSQKMAQAIFILLVCSCDASQIATYYYFEDFRNSLTFWAAISTMAFISSLTNPLTFYITIYFQIFRVILLLAACYAMTDIKATSISETFFVLIVSLFVLIIKYQMEYTSKQSFLHEKVAETITRKSSILKADNELHVRNSEDVVQSTLSELAAINTGTLDIGSKGEELIIDLLRRMTNVNSKYSSKFFKTTGGINSEDESGGFLHLMLNRQGYEANKMRKFRAKQYTSVSDKFETDEQLELSRRVKGKNRDSLFRKTLYSVSHELRTQKNTHVLAEEMTMLEIATPDLSNMLDWNFGDGGIFDPVEGIKGHELYFTLQYAFVHYDLYTRLPVEPTILHKFSLTIESHYLDVAYHNRLHAADTVQTAFWFLSTGEIDKKENLTINTISAILLAAAVHDVGHPGKGNSYHVNCENDLSLAFNDLHCLENYHLHLAFQVMRLESHDILNGVSSEDKREIRHMMIDAVIATDLALHFDKVAKFQELSESNTMDLGNLNHATTLASTLLHAADISSPAKNWPIYKKWIDRVFYEFVEQGDAEKTLGILPAPMMDKEHSCPPKAQQGFINYFVAPLFETLTKYSPAIKSPSVYLRQNVEQLKEWESSFDSTYFEGLGSEDILPGTSEFAYQSRIAAQIRTYNFIPRR